MRSDSEKLTALFRAEDVDTHFTAYHELMARKVQEVLLVASLYDAYTLEEDGSLASKIIHEYNGLNLSRPPRLTKVSSAAEALQQVEQRHFDLVIAMPHLDDMDPFELGKAVKGLRADLPVILLTHGSSGDLPGERHKGPGGIDRIAVWTGDSDLLLALIKSTEDRLNVEKDTQRAMVRVLLLVEDSPLYRSIFLPLIYKEVVVQTQAILEEGLNEEHRLLKMRARPKILVAETYEQAVSLYERYKKYIFGVLSDTRFPKNGQVTADAGVLLLERIKKDIPYLPLLLLSSEPENRKKAEQIPAVFVDKNSPLLSEQIHQFFLNHLGFGDFIFRSADGREIGRASDLQALEELLPEIPDEPIYYEASRNRFSNWFMARSEIKFASLLARIPASDFADVDQLRQFVISSIRALRKWRQKGVVVQFKAERFDPEISDFIKVGKGSMGGKARGLAFFSDLMRANPEFVQKFPSVNIRLPRTLVISTEGFESLVSRNPLPGLAGPRATDDEVARHFLDAEMPPWLQKALEAFLRRAAYPLSIRSSSLLEDAHFFPYAGLYKTFMVPNNHPNFTVRLRHLVTAVKLVYASTFFQGPRTFSMSTAQQFRKESMAVIVQEITGGIQGDYFYPYLSGVAQSENFYPVAGIKPRDGVARIVLGMGKSVEEGDGDLRFCPRYPAVLPHFSKIEDILANAQRSFYALKIKDYSEDLHFFSGTNLEKRDVVSASSELPVRTLCSAYDPDEHRLRDTMTGKGFPVVTFAGVLKYEAFPLARLLAELLEIGRKGMGCPVEFEFSANLTTDQSEIQGEFSVLQMRPLAGSEGHMDIAIGEKEIRTAFCYSTHSLGHIRRSDIFDVVYVRTDSFDAGRTPDIAAEIRRVNAGLAAENRKYLLAGPGRWGSFDRFLGIPVKWQDISGVGAIIELRNENLKADPSEGSHFFQQITAMGIPYVTVSENTADFFDWQWIGAFPPFAETRYLCHVRFDKPIVVTTDGRSSRCVMRKPE